MLDLTRSLVFAMLTLTLPSAWAFDDFICQCKATGPGYEETNRDSGAIDKICSYSCNCIAWEVKKDPKTKSYLASNAVTNINQKVHKTITSAYSREDWDTGSHICHGQYSWKPNLNDPNWKIKVKFDTFTVNSQGDVFYPEGASREIAQGVNYVDFKYAKKAKEVSAVLKKQLKNGRP